jgi:hypothetical protein
VEKVSQSRMLKNIDWEDITKDRREFIHGDFGNENRKDLCIYKIAKDSLLRIRYFL